MIGGVRVYNKFEGVDAEYFATIKVTPTLYNYIHTNSVIAKDNSTECFKITRDLEHISFGFLKDRYYAGLLAVYAEIFKAMEDKSYNETILTNLYALAFETDNDIMNKTISFDIVFVEAQKEEDLINNEIFKEYCEKYDAKNTSKHTAIFSYGKLFKFAVSDLKLLNKVWHLKAYKLENNGMVRVKLPSDAYYKDDSQQINSFVSSILEDGSELLKYVIGLTTEEA